MPAIIINIKADTMTVDYAPAAGPEVARERHRGQSC